MTEGFATPPPAPAPRTRPATVTVAGLLMLVVAACSVIYLVASIVALGPMADAFEEAYAGTELAGGGTLLAASSLLVGVGYLLVGVTLAILTIFNNQGRNGARITTWVVGGLGLCCGGLSLLGGAIGDLGVGGMTAEGQDLPDGEDVAEILAAHLPGWFEPLTLTTNVVGVLALAVGLVLLALPPSNEFFRKRGPHIEPPPAYPQVG